MKTNRKVIALASNNQKKIKELKEILLAFSISVKTPGELDIDFEVEETGSTFEENAALKSEELCRLTSLPSVADDSGLCVEALNGEPGLFSARYGKQGMNDRERTQFLLDNMRGKVNRNAYYYCAIAFSLPGKQTLFFKGRCDGIITEDYDEIGQYGFGYDPIFYFPPLQERFSRVLPEVKHQYSHRGLALSEFKSYLEGNNTSLATDIDFS